VPSPIGDNYFLKNFPLFSLGRIGMFDKNNHYLSKLNFKQLTGEYYEKRILSVRIHPHRSVGTSVPLTPPARPKYIIMEKGKS